MSLSPWIPNPLGTWWALEVEEIMLLKWVIFQVHESLWPPEGFLCILQDWPNFYIPSCIFQDASNLELTRYRTRSSGHFLDLLNCRDVSRIVFIYLPKDTSGEMKPHLQKQKRHWKLHESLPKMKWKPASCLSLLCLDMNNPLFSFNIVIWGWSSQENIWQLVSVPSNLKNSCLFSVSLTHTVVLSPHPSLLTGVNLWLPA